MKNSLLILGLILTGCSSSMTYDRPPPAPAVAQGPVILNVVSRDSTIVARSSTNGPVYSVHNNSTGRVVVPNMTLPQLQAQHPELANYIRSSHTSVHDPGAWAGVE